LIAIAAVLVLAGTVAAGALRYWRASPRAVRIAVLPFENLSLDANEEAVSEGLFDDLLTSFGGTQPDRIEVIGRRSVSGVTVRGPGSLRELGKRLNVSYVLESSARRGGDSLRISSRLVQTSGEAVRWSATFAQDGAAETFEHAVLARIAAGVLTTLFPGASPAQSMNFCAEGRDAYETGRMLVNRGGLRDLEQSLGYFQKAGCPQARAQAADILVRLAKIGRPPADSWESARAAASSALNADSGIALAHLATGNIAFWHDWNWKVAETEFRKALRLNPSNPDAHHDLAWLQVAMGRGDDALTSLDTAIELDPLSARTRIDSAWLLLQIGQFARAAAEARRALELNPGMNEARLCLSRALLYVGDAQAAVNAVKPLMPAQAVGETAILAPAALFRRLIEFHAAGAPSDPYQKAWLMAWLGSPLEAVSALEKAYETRSLMMPLIASDPAFRPIRGDPRFRAILRRMALEP
jgi:serine/threonine-protein kinase